MATSSQAGGFALEAGERPISLRKFTGYLVLAGLVNATIAAFLVCRLPASHQPALHSLLIRALIYVACAAAAGAAGARFYWNRSSTPFTTDPPLSFPLFALVNAAAWVWVPAIVLLSRQDSPASAALSAVGAALLASGLRRIIPPAAGAPHRSSFAQEAERREMFAATLHTPPGEAYGYVIALCIYATGYFLVNNFYLNAGAPLALGAFLFAWKLTLEPFNAPAATFAGNSAQAHAASRLAQIALAAVLVTLFALLFGIGHRNQVEAARAALASRPGTNFHGENRRFNPVTGISGYESIILWPVPERKQIVAPVPIIKSPFAAKAAKPLVIHFDGPYWYFQPPGKRPGPLAHQAHGNPIAVNIEADNFLPLSVEAVQYLASPIRLDRCREVQVSIENSDNLRGAIALGVLLTDSSAPGKPELYLGQQPVVSSQPGQFSVKVAPAQEVVRFPMPASARIRKFDQMTVLYLPGPEHWQVGAKIAIEQFELIPR